MEEPQTSSYVNEHQKPVGLVGEVNKKAFDLSFGEALEELKRGRRIAREGWNGKGMFIFLRKGNVAADSSYVTETDIITGPVEGIGAMLFNIGDYGTVTRLPNINMKAASGSTVTGWLASQTDMLANDWLVLP